MGRSKIEWTDYTFNPWIGCTKVSDGCKFCYAERENAHWKWVADGWGPEASRRRTSAANWEKVLQWDRAAAAEGVRRKVFCASLADVFEDRPELWEWRNDLLWLVEQTPHLDWLLLTKRPENVNRMVGDGIVRRPVDWFHANRHVFVGTSIENQLVARGRLDALRQIDAAARFVSCEPLLGPVGLLRAAEPIDYDWDYVNYELDDGGEPEEFVEECEAECDWVNYGHDLVVNPEHREWESNRLISAKWHAVRDTVDWVICGGESGPHARPIQLEWVRSLRDQCVDLEIPFFFKQWGEWNEAGERVGKKAAGRLLDGREWNEFPKGIASSPAAPRNDMDEEVENG